MTENTLEYRTLPGLWREYEATERLHAFKAETKSAAQEWQGRLMSDLTTLLGVFNGHACELSPQQIETRQEDGFTCETVAIQTRPGEFMPCQVLIPSLKVADRLKPVIALHGHGTWGGAAIVKLPEDPLGTSLNQQLNYDYSGQLAQRGYMVFVPELRGFGKRLEAMQGLDGRGGLKVVLRPMGHHHIDGKVLADVAQEIEIAKSAHPVKVVDQDG
mgnify:CR=1 FL=1